MEILEGLGFIPVGLFVRVLRPERSVDVVSRLPHVVHWIGGRIESRDSCERPAVDAELAGNLQRSVRLIELFMPVALPDLRQFSQSPDFRVRSTQDRGDESVALRLGALSGVRRGQRLERRSPNRLVRIAGLGSRLGRRDHPAAVRGDRSQPCKIDRVATGAGEAAAPERLDQAHRVHVEARYRKQALQPLHPADECRQRDRVALSPTISLVSITGTPTGKPRSAVTSAAGRPSSAARILSVTTTGSKERSSTAA